MSNYVLGNILFNVSIRMDSDTEYTISATASNVVTFETNICCNPKKADSLKKEFDIIYDAIKNSRIALSRMELAQEYALGIYFEYTYQKNGKTVIDGYELYYQPHFTIEEAIDDAMKVKYR